jgi:transcriptional regulator GlxA family with amidase domain
LLEVLDCLFDFSDQRRLCSEGFVEALPGRQDERLRQVQAYIVEHFKTGLSVKEAAGRAHLGVEAFCRYFRKATGRTFTQYINEFRIGYARRLLTGSPLSVSQIAWECGFESPAYFSRVFRQFTGLPPVQYQQQWQKLQD